MHTDLHLLSSYHYDLDERFIAQHPADPADSSKLLVRTSDGRIEDRVFYELPSLLDDSHVMFFNDSKVIRSRIVLQGAKLTTRSGGIKTFDGEIFFLEETSDGSCKCMVYPWDYFPVWGVVEANGMRWAVEEIVYEGRMLRSLDADIWTILERYGRLPLPPYIEYDASKESHYQTIFADKRGSLAAPTASLHFTPRILNGLEEKGIERHSVTLHVGLGTFKNIYTPDIRDYEMHAERIEIPISLFTTIARLKSEGKIILAVGTTVTRTLESLPYLWRLVRDEIPRDVVTDEFWDIASSEKDASGIISDTTLDREHATIRFSSRIFIHSDFSWRIVGEMITNLHLPSSTLFMLVASRLGLEEAKRIYEYAKEEEYRFFSFGDAMWLRR